MGNRAPSDMEIKVITLGTAGGPQWWRTGAGQDLKISYGISTAVVVGDDVYLIDAGYGAAHQLIRAGYSMRQVRAIFVTHLHSDHTSDLPAILLYSLYEATDSRHLPIPIFGPASSPIEGELADQNKCFGPKVNGIQGMVENLEYAFNADLFDRMEHGLRAGFKELFSVQELQTPEAAENFTINDVYSDEAVTVRAAQVDHATMKPAFAFRFDTPKGSVTISGDTAPCDELVELAEGSEILLHEAINQDWMDSMYPAGVELSPMKQAALLHHQESHSTVREACEVADKAKVKRLVLHHLVPGNLPSSSWAAAANRENGEVIVAEDLDIFIL